MQYQNFSPPSNGLAADSADSLLVSNRYHRILCRFGHPASVSLLFGLCLPLRRSDMANSEACVPITACGPAAHTEATEPAGH